LAKIKKEVDLNEHSLAIHYDYDIVPLPDDIIDKANKIEREK
jgi:sulfur carrier protein ThiS